MSIEQIDLGYIECPCGCKQPAGQFVNINGFVVPLPLTNPMTHYRKYKQMVDERLARLRQYAKDGLDVHVLEHFKNQGNFDEVRGQI